MIPAPTFPGYVSVEKNKKKAKPTHPFQTLTKNTT